MPSLDFRFRAALPLVVALVLVGCGRAPMATVAPRAASLQAQSHSEQQALEAVKPAVEALMSRCFAIMTANYGAKACVTAQDFHEYLDVDLGHCGALINAIDVDGDHQASEAELTGWGCAAGGLGNMRDAVISPAFAKADEDRNHKLSFAEAAKAAIGLGDQPAWPLGLTRADFDQADQDRNGTLSPLEFDHLASAKLAAGLKTAPAKQLPAPLAKIFFKTIPWSH